MDPYQPEIIQIIRLDATDTRPERWSWSVDFNKPQDGLNQDGYAETLAKALLCVSTTIWNARDAQREDEAAGTE